MMLAFGFTFIDYLAVSLPIPFNAAFDIFVMTTTLLKHTNQEVMVVCCTLLAIRLPTVKIAAQRSITTRRRGVNNVDCGQWRVMAYGLFCTVGLRAHSPWIQITKCLVQRMQNPPTSRLPRTIGGPKFLCSLGIPGSLAYSSRPD